MKIETVTTVSMSDNEFNAFVNAEFPAIKGNYEIVAFEELANGVNKVCVINMEFHDKYSTNDVYEEFDDFRYVFNSLCHELVKRGIIPTGTIIVDCSW